MMGGMTSTMIPDPTALQTALGWTSVLGGIMNPSIGNIYPQQQSTHMGSGSGIRYPSGTQIHGF